MLLALRQAWSCRAMLPEERNDLSSFTGAARQRVAGQVSCTVQQVCHHNIRAMSQSRKVVFGAAARPSTQHSSGCSYLRRWTIV